MLRFESEKRAGNISLDKIPKPDNILPIVLLCTISFAIVVFYVIFCSLLKRKDSLVKDMEHKAVIKNHKMCIRDRLSILYTIALSL